MNQFYVILLDDLAVTC